MKKSAFAVMITATLACGFSSAADAGTPALGRKMFRNLNKELASRSTVASIKKKAGECTDFSGQWRGTCTDSYGETYDEEIRLEQEDCDWIDMGGFSVSIGGSTQLNDSDTGGSTFSATIYPQWNSSWTGLKHRMTFSGRTIGGDEFYSGKGQMTQQMVGDTLVQRNVSEFEFEYSGNVSRGSYWEECTLQRVP